MRQNVNVAPLEEPSCNHARAQNDNSNAQRDQCCGEVRRFQSDALPVSSYRRNFVERDPQINKALDVDLRCPVTLKVISESDISVMSRPDFVFYAKPARRRAFVTRMLPLSSAWVEPVKTTSTRWSL